jgi:hypothetical protein
VRHDLHRLAQVVALALALDDMVVYLAGGDVIVAGQGDVQIALVVAEIEVDFTTVGENEYFAVPVVGSICAHECIWWGWLTYSFGFMVPASTLRYGSTLIDETLRPIVFSSRPVEEAVTREFGH